MWLDNIAITCLESPTPPPPNITVIPIQEVDLDLSLLATYRPLDSSNMYSLSGLISLPLRTKHGSRVIYLFIRDFWMYNYDNRSYNGLLKEIIITLNLL